MKNKYSEPNSEGFFGNYGGKFVPETLMEALDELEKCYGDIKSDSEFQKKIDKDLVPQAIINDENFSHIV